jgi:predicted dehydrogenase
VYHFDGFFIATEAAWYEGDYVFQCNFRFQFEKALLEYKDGKLTVFHADSAPEEIAGEEGAKTNGINLPDSNAYYNEIRYFTDCVLRGEDCDKIKPEELETVLDLIAQLNAR